MPDEMMDSLRKAFMKDKKNAIDECPMADKATAYAFGELGPDETEKVKEHIHTCRHCLDLVMDIKMAEEEAESMKDQNVEVLPGLQQAINKGKKPSDSILNKIGAAISDFFGQGFGLKPVAVMAVLVMCVGIFLLWDGTTPDQPYSIQILLNGRTQTGFRGGQPEYKEFQVEAGGEMKSGDYFRFQTKIDSDAFVYVVFRDSSGKIEVLEKGLITGEKSFFIPDGNKWFRLDQNTGLEKLYLLASKSEIEDFNKKIADLKSGDIETVEKVFPEATIQSFSFEHR
jgi:hypothetical protein